MVAPTRTPQARGVKCDLCKKILAASTWLDQTKLAKDVEDAQQVLELIRQHKKSNCPCIPQDIGNLLTGSTHFEVHRLVSKNLDALVHKRQHESYRAAKRKKESELSQKQAQIINDCNESHKSSRFIILSSHYDDSKLRQQSSIQLKHLIRAIDYWKLAMEDSTHPFNPKLALRLGLTHHVIYAAYLFKYYKILDYQLLTANLLLNLFKTIEGVTTNAIIHANYILIRALKDCNQFQLARHQLKQATKISNYTDKTHYESILLTCAACELSLLNGDNTITNTILNELSSLAVIKPDDKLQHYYARTLAISIIIKYIQYFPDRSNLCFEFYHTFRYLSAIIRRCYESSFALVLSKEDVIQPANSADGKVNQILDHSWIRFAVCDFVFSTFDLLSNFYVRSGQPENLELLYNGLNLISYRTGSCYWQTRMASIGVSLDLLCDKLDHAKKKIDFITCLIRQDCEDYLSILVQLDIEVSRVSLSCREETVIFKIVIDLLERLKNCQLLLLHRVSQIELYDCKQKSYSKTNNYIKNDKEFIVTGNHLGHLSFKLLKLAVASLVRSGALASAKELVLRLSSQFENSNCVLEYNDCQDILEILLQFAGIDKSDQHLLGAVDTTDLFLKKHDELANIKSQLSQLSIDGDHLQIEPNQNRQTFDTIETLRNFSTLSIEETLVSYLRNSEPSPDYLIYRRVHEMMFCQLLKKEQKHSKQLLYHFTEASTSNTMRYRWMMFEEQQSSASADSTGSSLKRLGFCSQDSEQLDQAMPGERRVVQFKYVFDTTTLEEHLLVVCIINSHEDPIYIHASNTTENFFENGKGKRDDFQASTIPKKFSTRIEEAKKTLFFSNNRSRTDARKKIEKELGTLLNDIENDWLGPFRFILCGKICDSDYIKFISSIEDDIFSIMNRYTCISTASLRIMLENAPLLSRDDFCQSISSIFNCNFSAAEARECYSKWLKSMEKFVANQASSHLKKDTYLQTLARSQIGLILDKDLEHIPFESLPIIKRVNQGLFRIPSLRLYNLIVSRCCPELTVNASETAYILDPAGNLAKTRERFESKLESHRSWAGTIGQPPTTEQLEQWLGTKQIYIFIGHGAGTTYYNKLCKGKGLSAMPSIKPLPIVMGCSSGRVLAEGPKLEPFGINWTFIFRGAPSYVGLLWDVTDTDIDRFLNSLLSIWLGSNWTNNDDKKVAEIHDLTEAIAHARDSCQLKFLVGSTPVVYGLPVCSKT